MCNVKYLELARGVTQRGTKILPAAEFNRIWKVAQDLVLFFIHIFTACMNPFITNRTFDHANLKIIVIITT